MSTNRDLIQKADMQLADLTSGGLLVAEQVKEFYEILIEASEFLPLVTTVTMNAPTWELPKMGFTAEVLRRANENSGLAAADRAKPALDKVQITSTEFIAEARIPYAVVEDNVANGSFVQTAMSYLGKALARDIEKLVLQGDTTSASLLLSSFDGVIKKATTNVVNAGGTRLSKSVFKTMVQTLPSQFLQGKLVFFTSKNASIDYIDSLSNRNTILGDEYLRNKAAGEYMGYPVVMVPLFPENLGGGSDSTVVLFMDPKNVHVGFHRDVRIETARDISSRQFIIVATVRLGVNYAHEPAVVKATSVLATAG